MSSVILPQVPDSFVGRSSFVTNLNFQIGLLAPLKNMVLITGPTGSGKSIASKALHMRGNRSHKPFVKVHCPSVQETLFEATLFGSKKGAFTSSVADTVGAVRAAAGGTLWLDEIGELSVVNQGKILNLLDGDFTPIG